MKRLFLGVIFLFVVGLLSSAKAAIVDEISFEPTRSEKRCITLGYKATYETCKDNTAPTDKCPHSDKYYKYCSKQQWCENYNYRIQEKDCKAPLVPVKLCDNGFTFYRKCGENTKKSCAEMGYKTAEQCKLSDKRCPFDNAYGICCEDKCKGFDVELDSIPNGYVQDGEACKDCSGKYMVKVKPKNCDGYVVCEFGPKNSKTALCVSGKTIKYKECKDDKDICAQKGFTKLKCESFEKVDYCPNNSEYVKCSLDCLRLAQEKYPNANIIEEDISNPKLDPSKTEIRGMQNLDIKSCNRKRPVVTLDLDAINLAKYRNIFDSSIHGVSFRLNFVEVGNLNFNGMVENLNIIVEGKKIPCLFSKGNGIVKGVVQFVNANSVCNNFKVLDKSKLAIAGDFYGSINAGKDTNVLIIGDYDGGYVSSDNSKLNVKGKLSYDDHFNNAFDNYGIDFGKNSVNYIANGLKASTTFVRLREGAKLNTPSIILYSVSDMTTLPNLLSSVSLEKNTQVYSKVMKKNNQSVLDIVKNKELCVIKRIVHIGSSYDKEKQFLVLAPDSLHSDKWNCSEDGNF